jgi:membrane-associated phospholipid phosphatase
VTDVLEPAATSQQSRPSPWEVGRARGTQRRRLLIGLGTLFGTVSVFFGFPTGREVITLWLLAFLFAIVGGDGTAWRRTVVRDWLPLLAGLFAYDLLRGFAKGNVDRAHVLPMIRFDEGLFGEVPTVWLQDKLFRSDPSWYDIVIVPVYMSHFVVPLAVAAGLWATSYARFSRYVATFMTLTVITLVTYAAFPAVPPWLASSTTDGSGQAYLPEVQRVVSRTLVESGIPTIHNAVQRGEAYANPVAAMPSFHAAVPMLVLLTFWPVVRRVGRALLVTYVLAMAFTLVYGGEHYVLDLLVGWVYAALAVVAVAMFQRRRAARLAGSRRHGSVT